MRRLLPIDPGAYVASDFREQQRTWNETNCYVDIWIELLHALGLDYHAGLAFTIAVDFEGDQWQFFKFPSEDLRSLYGIEVAEMNPWRGIEFHIDEQLGMGRLLTVEVDARYLPDTVSYGIEHVKTTIVANMIDRDHRRLGYFHGAGYYELDRDDYAGVFGIGRDRPEMLPPYVELLKIDAVQRRGDPELVDAALVLARGYLARRPATNPVTRFAKRLAEDLDWLRAQSIETFHEYAFATLRQFGSSAELTGFFCDWLAERGEPVADAARAWSDVAARAKAAMFQLARMASGRDVDGDALLDPIARQWDGAMELLVERYA